VNGRELIFFCGGDGVVYAFEPLGAEDTGSGINKLRKVWQFDCDPAAPKENVHRYNSNRREGPSNIYGMPVFHQGRLYVAGGGDVFWGKNEAWLKCLNPAGSQADAVWSYALQRHVLGTPAVHHRLVYIADCGRVFHCIDAETGRAVWTHDIRGEAWASPLVADGKVFLGTRAGEFVVLAASREKKLLSSINLGSPISATAAAANGTLYVATMSQLYAVKTGARPK
jgi:outer membrane protein assembly factor BamB